MVAEKRLDEDVVHIEQLSSSAKSEDLGPLDGKASRQCSAFRSFNYMSS